MSTTVTYKGNTLTTATNQTRTLLTEGKYMEGDVTISDTTPTFTTQTKSKAYTPSTSQQTDSISPDSGYDGLSQVDITVDAVPNATKSLSLSTAYSTAGGVRMWGVKPVLTIGTAGYLPSGTTNGNSWFYDVVSAETIDPTAGARTIGAANNMMEGAVNVLKSDYYGVTPELVIDNLLNLNVTFADTDFATWTPSKTAATIQATATQTYSADLATYDYMLLWRTEAKFVYDSGTTMKAAMEKQVVELYQGIFKRPNSLANVQSSNYNSNVCATFYTAPFMDYWNTNGAHTMTFTGSYGIYPAAVAATFSSATSNTPTITLKRPTISARCNDSYWKVASATAQDEDNSTLKIIGQLWRVKKSSSPMFGFYKHLIDSYNAMQ